VSFEPKDGQAFLFLEDQKAEEHFADYNGEIAVGERRYWIKAWEPTSKNGRRYLKIQLRPKEGRRTTSDSDRPAKEGRNGSL